MSANGIDIDGNLQSVTSRGGIVHTVSRNSVGYVSSGYR